ncbi:phosphonate metabolism protein/1,5-bisphosphokinase (PRPP-forming) PhnN [Afifella sp. JA880]|uniref:phosphonate metabolism protein/1,5-bisphosphokinase (PRPP-forming) PhnN n=1 Tax=Afifella sp. JA880 TaxID=2975280 RepID=UPI0021BAA808|nr:phosphonate metabolism protein/1,5-bisphosphokinase (PRPP-forming) PhnN [Afifella sp. JA880]MCT8267878.1 phosphonate metabolism protein/1,5-bisphosphokinase (PRPP-forming) PhnN [Afifella sp. JA880]
MNDPQPFRTGTLVLVVGPSGAGKDSLIDYARQRLLDVPYVVFPRRTVTRSESDFEDNLTLSETEFSKAAAAGAFALSWEAHGLAYGIPKAIEADLAGGSSVVVNVSRMAIEPARAKYRPLRVVVVSARRDVLFERLNARGRESLEEIARRLDRADLVSVTGEDVAVIDNSGPIDVAGEAFVSLLQGCIRGRQER